MLLSGDEMFKSGKNKIYMFLYINAFMIFLNIILLYFAKKYSNLVENFYSRKLFLYITKPLSIFSNLFNFSLGELAVALAILFIVFLSLYTIYSLFSKKWKSSILSLLVIVFILLFNLSFYQLAWGLNNYRQSTEEIFEISDVNITVEDLEHSYRYLVEETNRLKKIIDSSSIDHITDKYIYTNAYRGYEKLSYIYPFINNSKSVIKPLKISNIFSASGYTGIYLPFFAEANINYMVPSFSKPFISNHEIAHQKGFAGEDDANFIGFLACYYHNDVYFKYSGYQAMMTYVGNSLYRNDPELYKEISSFRSDSVLSDIKDRIIFWDIHIKEKVNTAHNKVNDTFLKANNQPEGIASYSKVTELFLKAHKAGLIN